MRQWIHAALESEWSTGEWLVTRTTAKQRRTIHYRFTVLWFTVGFAVWLVLRDALWFVGFMSIYAIWWTHISGWSGETPVEGQEQAPASRAPR